MSSRGKPSPESPHAVAKALGLKVPGGEQITWASLVDPAVDLYCKRRSTPRAARPEAPSPASGRALTSLPLRGGQSRWLSDGAQRQGIKRGDAA